MEVNIGIRNVTREVSVEVELSAQEVSERVQSALSEGRPLTFEDAEGKTVIVPAEAVGYVQFAEAQTRRVGFGF